MIVNKYYFFVLEHLSLFLSHISMNNRLAVIYIWFTQFDTLVECQMTKRRKKRKIKLLYWFSNLFNSIYKWNNSIWNLAVMDMSQWKKSMILQWNLNNYYIVVTIVCVCVHLGSKREIIQLVCFFFYYLSCILHNYA